MCNVFNTWWQPSTFWKLLTPTDELLVPEIHYVWNSRMPFTGVWNIWQNKNRYCMSPHQPYTPSPWCFPSVPWRWVVHRHFLHVSLHPLAPLMVSHMSHRRFRDFPPRRGAACVIVDSKIFPSSSLRRLHHRIYPVVPLSSPPWNGQTDRPRRKWRGRNIRWKARDMSNAAQSAARFQGRSH